MKHKKKHGFLFLILITGFIVIGIMVVYLAILINQLPSPEQFSANQISESTKIYDRTGSVVLYELYNEEKRTLIKFEEIPQIMKSAILAAEDANFYTRPAFDWRATLRAFIVNLREGRMAQGGSTITQQLARNVFLSSEKTINRKIKELILAFELENQYTKNEILAFYLNQIPFGQNSYGIEAAANTYFNKSAKELTLGESAILASLPKAPSYFSPWGSHKEELIQRQQYILNRMEELKFINTKEKELGKKEKIKFNIPNIGNIKAPHFSLMIKDYLINHYGEDMIMKNGLKVITTLDWDLQKIAEQAIDIGSQKNEELYGSKNAAIIAEDSKTGQILALIGSRNYFDIKNDGNFNVVTQGLRQPGSALKPFVYLTAFQKGYTPQTIIYDVPTEFDTRNSPETSYKPENFDGKIHGPVPMEQALARSLNIPAVKTLYLAGFDDVLKNLHQFGITTLNERWRYGLSLTLGGGEIKLIDLINAYSTLSQEGVYHKQNLILKIEDKDGNILEEYTNISKRVIDPQYPRLINKIISSAELRSPIFGGSLKLTIFPDRDVALKTGTSEDHRDAWALGYTPSLTVGVWAGNNDNTPMIRQGSSILAAVPIWSAFLQEALKKYPPETFNNPDAPQTSPKPMLNGKSEFTPIINGKKYPQIHTILFYADKHDPLGQIPENPQSDSQFENWETGILDWAKTNISNWAEYNKPLPEQLSMQIINNQVQNNNNDNDILITNFKPKNGEFLNSPLQIQADIKSESELEKVELYFNRRLINSVANFNYSNPYYYRFNLTEKLASQNSIEIRAVTKTQKKASESVIIFNK